MQLSATLLNADEFRDIATADGTLRSFQVATERDCRPQCVKIDRETASRFPRTERTDRYNLEHLFSNHCHTDAEERERERERENESESESESERERERKRGKFTTLAGTRGSRITIGYTQG